MGNADSSWDRMYAVLTEYRKKQGHCNVPTDCRQNPALGRWVATQRHKRKIDGITAAQIRRLDELDFVWSPGDAAWDRMYQGLVAFRKKQGHCNVPAHWPDNENLASWVANQRHRRKIGVLAPARVKRLNAAGFAWGIYRCQRDESVAPPRGAPRDREEKAFADPAANEERLYNLGRGVYVQHSGKGRLPREMEAFAARHRNDLPPYFPLPTTATTYILGDGHTRRARRIRWKGKGKLPREILDYVSENGIMPPHA